MTVGLVTARVAVLVEHYHLSLPEIANLTDRTIHAVYFHAREKDGSIRIPVPVVEATAAPETLAGTLANLAFLRAANLITEENYRQCVADAERKHGEVGGQA